MRAIHVKEAVKACFAINRPLCIEGSPGTGKTSIVQQAAKELGVDYIERNMPTMLVEDFGIPVPTGGVLKYQIPDWFPTDPNTKGILCFDDRNQAGPDLQKVLANIIQARNLHGVPLSPGWVVVSTGNQQKHRAGANRVLSHLRNRETVIEMETSVDDWCAWALNNDVPVELVSFIRFRNQLLDNFKPDNDVNATPRSWAEGVGALIGNVPQHLELPLFTGAVGEGPASEFMGFLKIFRNLPDPDDVMRNPDNHKVPTDPSTLYALAGALSNRVTTQNVSNFFSFVNRLPTEFNILAVTMAMRQKKSVTALTLSPDWKTWSSKNMKVMF